MKLTTYEDWKHCITVLCGIPLTSEYIEKRLLELENSSDYGTRKSKETWGNAHHERVISWFRRAETEMSK